MMLTSAEKSARYRAKNVQAYRERKSALARTDEHKAVRREYMRKWREENRERHNELARQSHRRNAHKHVERNADYHLRAKYGISRQDKADMVAAQNGLCLICAEPFSSSRSTHVDHCHRTGCVRGILCHRCNTKLGWLETHEAAITQYLGR